jgi:hypothetical protein
MAGMEKHEGHWITDANFHGRQPKGRIATMPNHLAAANCRFRFASGGLSWFDNSVCVQRPLTARWLSQTVSGNCDTPQRPKLWKSTQTTMLLSSVFKV